MIVDNRIRIRYQNVNLVYSPFVSDGKTDIQYRKKRILGTPGLGGIHPTLSPKNSIKDADIICIGEGEGAFTDLVVSLRDGYEYHIDHKKNRVLK